YVLADLLVRGGLPLQARPALPAAPATVEMRRAAGGVELTWSAVDGAASYRIYRATSAGGPWKWLNSEYAENAPAPSAEPRFRDRAPDGPVFYAVTAVDAAGRESRWPDRAVGAR